VFVIANDFTLARWAAQRPGRPSATLPYRDRRLRALLGAGNAAWSTEVLIGVSGLGSHALLPMLLTISAT
jgi:hypothetical protein